MLSYMIVWLSHKIIFKHIQKIIVQNHEKDIENIYCFSLIFQSGVDAQIAMVILIY